MSAEKVRTYLMEHGVGYETHSHQVAYTTSGVAEAEHIPDKAMAKPVMLMADDELIMAVMPGDEKVDLDKANTALETAAVRLAEESEFAPRFPDCERGAEPPFGALYDVPTLVDVGLTNERITFNAGTHSETISMALDDYLELTNPKKVDLAIG